MHIPATAEIPSINRVKDVDAVRISVRFQSVYMLLLASLMLPHPPNMLTC